MRLERIEWDGADAGGSAPRELRALAPTLDEVTGEVGEIIAPVARRAATPPLRELGERFGEVAGRDAAASTRG